MCPAGMDPDQISVCLIDCNILIRDCNMQVILVMCGCPVWLLLLMLLLWNGLFGCPKCMSLTF